MCKHNFSKKYYWIEEFDGKILTLPLTNGPFIKIEFIDDVSKLFIS